jgi:2,5-diamino-6-(ribosylamino)-4(3H)-pyrimidinone 5'-phosphate reductase
MRHGIYHDLRLVPGASEHPKRPYVFINMVASVDGKTAVEGKASGLGTAADRSGMRSLRSKADAVMVGAGTLRAEKLSLGLDVDDPRPRPMAVILAGTGEVPLGRNLVRDGRQKVLVVLAESAEKGVEGQIDSLSEVEVRRVAADSWGRLDLTKVLRVLKSDYDVSRLLVEGGPTLNHALVSAELADELFVTLAPRLLGGGSSTAPAILDGALTEPRNLRLLSAHPVANEMFLRYALETRSSTH